MDNIFSLDNPNSTMQNNGDLNNVSFKPKDITLSPASEDKHELPLTEEQKKALEIIEENVIFAARHNVEATIYVGHAFLFGEGVVKNPILGLEYLKLAAIVPNNPIAQYDLALAYDYGIGVPKDHRKALFWYARAAEQDNPYCKKQFDRLKCEFPQLTEEELKKEVEAAERGDFNGMNFLGCRYEYGVGVDINPEKAAYWYDKAVDQRKKTPLTEELKMRAVALGHVDALVDLGLSYIYGKGVKKNRILGTLYLRLATRGFGYLPHQEMRKALMYEHGISLSYEHGARFPKNHNEALYWYAKGADEHNDYCMERFDELRRPLLTEEELGKELETAEQGDVNAMSFLGFRYQYGVGVYKDPKEAKYWYEKAADQGNERAKEGLEKLRHDHWTLFSRPRTYPHLYLWRNQ